MSQDSVPDGSYNDPFLSSVWDGVLAVLCAICHHAIVGDPFLIWAKCERNENASSLQDISAKKTCLRRFRLCQPYVITPGFFPCRHHAMLRTFAQWDRRWHVIAPRPVHEGPVGMWRFDVFVLWTSQGDKSRWKKWFRVACVACCMRCVFDSWDICQVLSGKARSAGLEHFEFEGEFHRISAMQGTASALFSCTFCIRIRNLIRSA